MAGRSIGILGGTFDPVHEGHLRIARNARRRFSLSEVWFIPCALSPLKRGVHAGPTDRLAMLELALAEEPAFRVLSLELARAAPSYTVDTLEILCTENPADAFTFIIGADSLTQLHAWRSPLRILELVRVVTLARPGMEKPAPDALRLPPPWPERLLADFVEAEPLGVSSSGLRRMRAEGRTLPEELVPAPVIRYIEERKLYL